MGTTILAIAIAFTAIGILCAAKIGRRRPPAADPFSLPIGEMPNMPAERSLAEHGTGFTIHQLNQATRSARRAAPAGQGSGGDGKNLSGAAAAGPQSWRGGRA